MARRGLLYDGTYHQFGGIEILAPGDEPWCHVLMPEDGWWRAKMWIRQLIFHTTKGMDPQHVKPGKGPGGKDKIVADWWQKSRIHSSAQNVIDNDGSLACLADNRRVVCWHATGSNHWSIGTELYQENDGGIYEAVYDTAVVLAHKLCELAKIPKWVPARAYNGHPMKRMIHGGPDMVGVFGHRDNTEDRGRGDPGDLLNVKLLASGEFRAVDYERYEDIKLGKAIQDFINKKHGTKLAVDGLMGPGTMNAVYQFNVDYNSITP